MSDDAPTTLPPANDGGCLPGGATLPCAECQCGDVRWVDTEAYCGDDVRLGAAFTGNCPDGPATVEILNGGTTIATVTSNLRAGRVDATWVAKAPTANWRTDRLRFRVTAAGKTCTSSNEFAFRQRPTTDWILLNNAYPRASAALGTIFEYHDAKLEANRVHYNVKVRTRGASFDATKQAAATTRIEAAWNDGFAGKSFHRVNCRRGRTCDCTFDCCKAGFRLDAPFVTSGEHLLVTIVHTAPGAARQGSSTATAGGRPVTATWGDPPRNEQSTYAHEIGHILGHFDEYTPPAGGTDPTGGQPVTPAAGDENLMSTSGNTRLLNRHYRRALAFLNSHAAADPYETVPP